MGISYQQSGRRMWLGDAVGRRRVCVGQRSIRRILGVPGRVVGDCLHVYNERCLCRAGIGIRQPDDPDVTSSGTGAEDRNDPDLYDREPAGAERSRQGEHCAFHNDNPGICTGGGGRLHKLEHESGGAVHA